MKQIVLVLAMAALTIAAAPPNGGGKSPSAKAKCGYTIQRANAAAGKTTPNADDGKPTLIRAVDKRLGGCPVLVLADGKLKAPPAFNDGPASKSPAQ
ncbi:hypothetical protein WBP06_07335 [Novosphingobium sp. BL-8H]|uniref:hypothetical protein n=1 Tax=Novosphingobium sp. BL-8H TaxID=3127640 RepID=UPI003756BBB3